MTSSFPRKLSKPIRVDELVAMVPGVKRLVGRGDLTIDAIAPIGLAGPGCLAFSRFSGQDGIEAIRSGKATATVTSEEIPEQDARCFIEVEDPRGWFIDAIERLFGDERPTAAIDPSARIHGDACLGQNVSIGAFTQIDAGARVGDGCAIGPYCHITGAATLGTNVTVQSHVSVGGTGLAFHRRPDGSRSFFPHLGRVFIGDEASIGTHSTVIRGIVLDTVIGEKSMIGNHVNIGHNCEVGAGVFISSSSVLTGGAIIEQGATLGAGVHVSAHVRVGQGSFVGIGSVIVKDVPNEARVFGNPAKPVPAMREF